MAAGNDSRFHDSVTLGAALTPIFTLTGQALGAVDHGADRLFFWDDSAGAMAPLTLGTNLSITGTTLNASGGSGGGDVSLSGTPVAGQAAEWTNATTIQGVAVTGTGDYVKATGPALSAPTVSTDAAVTAGTNAQGQGPLTADVNVVTTASANGGVTLPAATAGRRISVINRSGNVINVFPATGAAIDGQAANTSLAMGSNVRLDFSSSSATAWWSTRQDATNVSALSGAGAGVVAALGIAVGSNGAPVVFNGAGGTPSSITLTNGTGLPIGTGVSGLATGAAAFLATPSSANLRALLTDEVGTGVAYFVGGALGTPASGSLANCTGLPIAGLVASTTAPIGVGTIELGAASDTTISRASAGVVAVEGVALARVIGSGTAAMGTTAIASGASATLVTVAATGVLTTDVIDWGFNGNPNSVTGYSAASTTGCLVITAYPTAGNVNFLVSNPTGGSITPGALTLNWKVTR